MGAFAVDLDPRIGEVQVDRARRAAAQELDPALAARLDSLEDVVLDDQRARVVVLPRLEHRARCRRRVAAALQFHGVEMGPVGDVIARVEGRVKEVAGFEVHEGVGPGADGSVVVGRVS